MTAPTYPDIAAFLTAQLDRLEGLAKACDDDGRWEDQVDSVASWDGQIFDAVVSGVYGDQSVASHIAQHDPAFVLADIASKRAVAKMWTDAEDAHAKTRSEYRETVANALTFVVFALAAPFADQPGYRPEWVVEA